MTMEPARQGTPAGATDPDAKAKRRAAQDDLTAQPPAAPAVVTRKFARVLDDLVTIPGTKIRVGLDPLLSLVPWAGTAVGATFGSVIIVDAIRLRAPVSVLARMGANWLIDWLLGLVPFVGAFVDVGYRSNRRNLTLLNRTIENRELVRRSSLRYWLGALVLLLAMMAIVIAVPVAFLLGLDRLLTGG